MDTPKISILRAGARSTPVPCDLIRRSFRDVAERFHLTRENCPRHLSNCGVDWVERDERLMFVEI